MHKPFYPAQAEKVASDALAQQTKGRYQIAISQIPFRKAGNDIFFFVPVTYISGNDLYYTAQNLIKDDFMWIRADDLLSGKNIQHSTRGTIQLSDAVRTVLQKELHGVIQELMTPAAKKEVPQSQLPVQVAGVGPERLFIQRGKI